MVKRWFCRPFLLNRGLLSCGQLRKILWFSPLSPEFHFSPGFTWQWSSAASNELWCLCSVLCVNVSVLFYLQYCKRRWESLSIQSGFRHKCICSKVQVVSGMERLRKFHSVGSFSVGFALDVANIFLCLKHNTWIAK